MKPYVSVGVVIAGCLLAAAPAIAAADADYGTLPVDPNVITDSTAYVSAPPVFAPDGQPGIQQVYTHRDGSRQITDTISVLGDAQAAGAALNADRSDSAATVIGQASKPVPVGDNGILITGTSPDRTHAMTVLLFTRGATTTQIEFEGAHDDPVPEDLVIDYGQRQDDAIQQQLAQ